VPGRNRGIGTYTVQISIAFRKLWTGSLPCAGEY
jgi:hypothetical protein